MNKVATGVAAAALGLGAVAGVWMWQSAGDNRRASLRATANAADLPVRAHRCAHKAFSTAPSPEPISTPAIAGVTATATDLGIRIEPTPDDALIIGVVADARAVATHIPALHDEFARRGVKLVVSLGGIGRTESEIHSVLRGLTGPWYLLASPGDWEPLSAHRRAVANLADAGVLDGVRVRQVRVGPHAIVTWPGAPTDGRTMAGADGCAFTASDTTYLSTLFSGIDGARVLMSHTPPRQSGPTATDSTRAGVSIGDRALARASAQAGVGVLVHGLLGTGPAPPAQPVAASGQSPVILPAGAADGIVDLAGAETWHPLALVITIEDGSVTWQYLRK